jgi:hypothetical protein
MNKLNPSQIKTLLYKFADFKKKQGYKSIVLQSLPTWGVQADSEFYSLESILKAINDKKGTNYVV